MMRRVLFVLLASAALFSLPAIATAQPAAAPSLTRVEFVLGGSTFAVSLPEPYSRRIRVLSDRIIVDFGKNSRLQRLLIISREASWAGGPLGPKRALPNGGRLAYRVEDDTGGGSGGPIAELNGILEFDGFELAVNCTDQGEWSRDPEWCLPTLGQLRRVKAP